MEWFNLLPIRRDTGPGLWHITLAEGCNPGRGFEQVDEPVYLASLSIEDAASFAQDLGEDWDMPA